MAGPGSSDFSIEHDFFEIVMRGRIRSADYRALAREFFNDDRVSPRLSGVLDLRQAEVDTSFGELAEFLGALRHLPRNTHGRVAIVATDPLCYGLSRTFAALQGFADQLRVFSVHETAMAWLSEAAPEASTESALA